MIYPPIKDLIEKAGNRYTLVIAAAKRARQLSAGDPPVIKSKFVKPVSIALNEIYNEKIIPIKLKKKAEYYEELVSTEEIIEEIENTIQKEEP